MRQYPIWVDMVNNSYNSSKSYGVNDYNIQNVKIGTSSRNSFDFAKIEMGVVNADNNNKKTYTLFVDNVLIKKAVYNPKTKEMEAVEVVPYAMPENELKIKFFKKWKDEQEAKDQTIRNERYAERLAVNGQ
jgi:hypothetical protein